ncbi:hypothetical protein [Sinorhizobium meliloti]|uniref:hypothetical protein n=1 Tax=Rhizobium meliloti TaxID=382 RepID=UPI000FD80C52|nr:hypothetical protein [Sinorhizobium meliloti]RVK93384.1 hypothetical protein CN152_23265 [Sinorhizobium meliloti]RVN34076.1 hypothetical protein CN113_35410 [Sinorhizobium meliloti]
MRRTTIFSFICMLASQFAGVALADEAPTGPYTNEGAYLKERYDRTTSIEPQYAVGLIRAVELQVDDQVKDGCFTNVSAVSARIRAQLENAKIAVYSEPLAAPLPFSPKVVLVILGFKVGGGCIASAALSVEYSNHIDLGSLAYTGGVFRVSGSHVIWQNSSLISRGGKVNDAILSQVQEWTDSLTADVAMAKRNENVQKLLAVWPSDAPQTAREFQAEMEKVLSKVRQ